MAAAYLHAQGARQRTVRLMAFESRAEQLRQLIIEAENRVDQAEEWHALRRAVDNLNSLRRQLAALEG